MRGRGRLAFLFVTSLLPIAAPGADRVYKSLDESGRVTYSAHPPREAAKVETLVVPPGPSAEAADAAVEQLEQAGQEADARFEKIMEIRQQRADARREAQERKREKEEAERQRRIDESLEELARRERYAPAYRGFWNWPYPPYPPRYPRPPRPQELIHPPNKPYVDHINPPTRNW